MLDSELSRSQELLDQAYNCLRYFIQSGKDLYGRIYKPTVPEVYINENYSATRPAVDLKVLKFIL